jgi:septum formation protein
MSASGRPLVLASASPRRRELVAALGPAVTSVASDVPEVFEEGVAPEVMVIELATRKAAHVAAAHPAAIVLGADTTVVCDGEVLNKPESTADARRMLRLLRGREHLVHTGLAVTGPGISATSVTTSAVRMRACSDDELQAYLATGESLDKAGAYGIQGAAGDIVESVESCYNNVVGLPLCAAARLLLDAGVAVSDRAPNCAFRSERACPCWPGGPKR